MFVPTIPLGGLAGFNYLERTLEQQRAASDQSRLVENDTTYLRNTLPEISSVEQLVADRRLMSVLTTAFGMEDRVNQSALLRQALEQGVSSDDTLANRIGDPRLIAFVGALSPVAGSEISIATQDVPELVEQYQSAVFRSAVGSVDSSQRLALQFREDVDALVDADASDRTLWFRVLGSPPLRQVFATALNIGTAVASLDIDRQADIFASQMERLTGDASVKSLADPAVEDLMISRFFALDTTSQAESAVTSPALQLLRAASQGTSLTQTLLLARL